MGQQTKRQSVLVVLCILGIWLGLWNGFFVQAQEQQQKTFTVMGEENFSIDGNGVITAYAGNKNAAEVIIPQTVNGITVTGIGEKVFEGCDKLTTIILPDTVESIGAFAFGSCTSLSDMAFYSEVTDKQAVVADYVTGQLTLPERLHTLDSSAFFNCVSIKTFAIDKSNAYFKTESVASSDNGEMLLSKDGTKLYRFAPAFHYAGIYDLPQNLVDILPYSCEGVGLNGGFRVPVSVVNIGEHAFYACHNLNDFQFAEPSKVATIGSCAFSYNSNIDIVLPASVTEIGTYAFAYCTNVQVELSKTQVTVIPEYAFYESDNLHKLTMPATLKRIEAYAFYGCNNLNNIYFKGTTIEKIGTGVFQNCNNLHEIELPSGVVDIENAMFNGCWNLNKIILPETVKTIGDEAFKDCKNIHVMVIPASVVYISNSSFSGANQEDIDTSKNVYSQQFIKGKLPEKGTVFVVGNLKYKVTKSKAKNGTVAVCGVKSKKIKSAAIGATIYYKGYKFKITEISKNAFKKCTKMKQITIGTNVTKIGSNAFSGDKKLKKITIKSKKLKSVGKNALKGISKKAVVKVPKMKYNKYKKLFQSKTGFKSSMKIKK